MQPVIRLLLTAGLTTLLSLAVACGSDAPDPAVGDRVIDLNQLDVGKYATKPLTCVRPHLDSRCGRTTG
ncbi:hypothetical protein [Nocardia sp. NPDC051570]|uniref:hypothetical protein n=1 Tax=Nocardia sp. NPDC051570 TaxID=3364324 RepID=UPI00379F731C